jgi:hypothetical protein
MPSIDIVTMRGMVPRIADHLLPNEAAAVAVDCQFDRGVIEPLRCDVGTGVIFPFTPKTIYHYYGDHWFAWDKPVEVMRSPIAQDQYNRVYYTDGEYPKVTYDAIASGGEPEPVAWYRLGVPAPDTPPNVTAITPPVPDDGVEPEDDPTDDTTRYYTETYVTGLGEEGPPGPPSPKATITVPNSTVDVGLSPAPTNNSNITARRLYRSVSGGGIADYLMVAELPIAQTTYTDTLLDEEIGPVLETYNYTMPPDGMRGICQMANGICAGFVGNSVLFSEPYLPYAWPDQYKMTTEHDIVAITAIDTALIVGTTGYPYIFQGVSPAAVTGQKLSHLQQACVSPYSMVALDGLVLYAAPDGLVGVGSDGGQVVTAGLITREQWQSMHPETMAAWYHEGKYVARTDTHQFIYDPQSGDIREITDRWDAAYSDMTLDALLIAKGTELMRWRGGDEYLAMRWRSKEFALPPGSMMACARVISDDIAAIGVKIFVDHVQVMELPPGAVPDRAFRLPAKRGRFWAIEVYGGGRVERIVIAPSLSEVAYS